MMIISTVLAFNQKSFGVLPCGCDLSSVI